MYGEAGVKVGGQYIRETRTIRLGCLNDDVDEVIDTLVHEVLHHIIWGFEGEEASRGIDSFIYL